MRYKDKFVAPSSQIYLYEGLNPLLHRGKFVPTKNESIAHVELKIVHREIDNASSEARNSYVEIRRDDVGRSTSVLGDSNSSR